MVGQAFARALFAALLVFVSSASQGELIPHHIQVSPAVDAWSHGEACNQFCVSKYGSGCGSGVPHHFVPNPGFPDTAHGSLFCTVTAGDVTRIELGAASQCSSGLINAGGTECRCPAGKYFNGGICEWLCQAGTTYHFSTGSCRADFADTRKSAGAPCPQCGNPVHPGTGNKYQREIDYAGVGAYPLMLVRHHNTLGANTSSGQRHPASFGQYWLSEYSRSLAFSGPFTGSTTAVSALRHDGRQLIFRPTAGQFVPDADIDDRLTALLDGSGAITGWTYYAAATEETESYSAGGSLLSITNRAGLSISLTYDSFGRVAQVADHFGRQLSFSYDGAQRITRITDPGGGIYDYGYDAQSRLVTVISPGLKTRTYHYEAAFPHAALTGITDENNQRFATWTYNSQGRASLSEHAGGAERTTFTYTANSAGSVIGASVTDPFTQTRQYGFQILRLQPRHASTIGPVCPTCGPAAQSLNTNGYATSRTDWNGNRIDYNYDLARNLETSRTEGLTAAGGTTPQTRTITTEWHATFRLPTRIAEPLRITTNAYDADGTQCGARGALCSRTIQGTTDANGSQGFSATSSGAPRAWTYTYNANGQVLTLNGPRVDLSDLTTYTYYANDDPDTGKRGNLATITNAASHRTDITAYNAHGRPLAIIDPNGLTTALAYDARQRLTSRTVGGETTSYDYDGVGQLTLVTLPDGSFLSYSYDAAHRVTGMQDNVGNSIAYTLDAMGNRTLEQVRDPASQLAQTRSRVFSNLNRLFRELGSQSQTTEYAYDNQGNVLSVKDPLNRITSNQYDALNRLKQVTDPGTGVTQYAYNGLDALTQVTDPRNLSTGYSVDGLGNLTLQSSPDTGTTANTYDVAGNLLTQTDAKGQVTSYAYDALNRVTLISFHDASRQVYAYDQGANGIGRLSSITERNAANEITSVIAYAYNPHGRVTAETRTVGGVQYATAYSYDAAGRLSGMTYPSGRSVAYSFDSLGRIGAVTTTKTGQTQPLVSNVAYHPFGGVKSYTLGNGQQYTRAYDQDGRIASYTLAASVFAIGYDVASRIEFISDVGTPANSNTYGYDSLDRLTSAVTPSTPFGYSYDAVGNRLSKTVGAGTETYSYSSTSNRIATVTPASSPPRSFVFDPNGSTANDGINTYAYDVRGRMVQATSAIGVTSYQVNALGQRIRKANSQADTVFHYDTAGRLIAETSPAGVRKREILYLGDIPVAVVQ